MVSIFVIIAYMSILYGKALFIVHANKMKFWNYFEKNILNTFSAD